MLLPLQCFAFGNLFIIGGGSQSDELVKEYLKLCGASNKLLIVAKASSLEEEVLAEVQTRFQTLGATNTHKYICQAQADQCLEQLSDVKCVYFSGGDQKKRHARVIRPRESPDWHGEGLRETTHRARTH